MKNNTITGTLVRAQRGRNRRAPENTTAAIRTVLNGGDRAIELDIALSSDKEIIDVHDDTVDRTTNGTGSVSDLSLRDLVHLGADS